MALSNSDKEILEQIVEKRGHCLKSTRCKKCPFRAMCLPEFLNPVPPSEPQRLQMAMDVLMHHCVIDGEVELEEIQRDFQWGKK